MFSRIHVLLLASIAAVSAREPLDRPNVVLFYLDDSGYDD
jgi:hypothetical protein